MEEYIKKQLEIIQKINRATTLMLQTQANALNDLGDIQEIISDYVKDVQRYMDRQAARDALQKISKTEIDNKGTM